MSQSHLFFLFAAFKITTFLSLKKNCEMFKNNTQCGVADRLKDYDLGVEKVKKLFLKYFTSSESYLGFAISWFRPEGTEQQ